MDDIQEVFFYCFVFLTHKFNIMGFWFSLFDVTLCTWVFISAMTTIERIFGKPDPAKGGE